MSGFNARNDERREMLKQIVRDLHEGSDIGAVRRRFADLIRNASAEEIASTEQALIEEGVPVEQVQKMCEVHVEVFERTLRRGKKAKALPGHPVHTFREENRVLRRILKRVKTLARKVPRGGASEEFERELARLGNVEIHYRRKENQLFPFMEKAGFTGPSTVMWGKHDEIRRLLKEAESAYRGRNRQELRTKVRALVRSMARMIFMEERILLPAALKRLSEIEWAEIRMGEPLIGYAWVEPGSLWDPALVLARNAAAKLGTAGAESHAAGVKPPPGAPTALPLDVGALTGEQVNLLLTHLPVDVTFVDENDRVRYYSQGKERVFPRSPGIIGRTVQNCHPPKSVHVVERILRSLKSGEKNAAEFWLTLNGRFVHIRYFPLRDGAGTYRGVIEVSQDCTRIRGLEGERRLLDW